MHTSGQRRHPSQTLSIRTVTLSIGRSLLAASLLMIVAMLGACEGHSSALAPAGTAAAQVFRLFVVMVTVASAVWLFVIGAAFYAARKEPDGRSLRNGRRLMLFGGVVLPLILLGTLSWFGFRQTNALLAAGDGLVIHVTGERWWWRVRYQPDSGPAVISANEIRMPMGQRVEFRLESSDVIHSFWIPSLGGKIDMMPGRVNRLVLEATREGLFRGACAEFCGLSHTLMEFDVVVMPPAEFEAWLQHEASDALPPATALAERGRDLFLQNGCGACHRVSGTPATGAVGPDLTHVGRRLHIAAGALPMEIGAVAGWVSHPEAVKPGVLMPAYPMLQAEQLVAIGTWLTGLE
ncbi:MAG: cytochrome c oxidase subunit II [Woeseia sp.]